MKAQEEINDWKEKYSTKLKEGFFSIKKPASTKEKVLNNTKPYKPPIVDNRSDISEPITPIKKTERSVNKADQQDKQNWSFK